MNHPLNLKRQLRCIYLSDFFSGLRITDAVWVALLAARGFSLWEIGLAESVYHIVSLFCEVPSGMVPSSMPLKAETGRSSPFWALMGTRMFLMT